MNRRLAACLVFVLGASACSGSGHRSSPTTNRSGPTSSTVPTTVPIPKTIPNTFMPAGSWHFAFGIGQEIVLLIGKNHVVSELTASGSPPKYHLDWQSKASIISARELRVLPFDDTPTEYVFLDASARHLTMQGSPDVNRASADRTTFCAGSAADAECGG
jgi:hypothetical protein